MKLLQHEEKQISKTKTDAKLISEQRRKTHAQEVKKKENIWM